MWCKFAGLLAAALTLAAQTPPPSGALTISDAVAAALRNYPSIRVSQEQMNAAAAGIRLAQTAYLPRVDTLAQFNRATRNTYYGLLLPQTVIPGVDGVASNNLGSVWDSGVGVLVSWQPFDFGLRSANVAAATAAREYARATLERTRYDVAVATADAFLTVLAAERTEQAAQATVSSWEILERSIHSLVAAQLRPGADEARVTAELAVARTMLAQARQAVGIARATLAQFIGNDAAHRKLASDKLTGALPAAPSAAALDPAANPLSVEQNAAVSQQRSQLKALQKTYYPQFLVQGLASARGTGMETDGARLGGANGLAPTVQDYGVGLTVTFPVMDKFAIEDEEAQQQAKIRAAQAQSRLIATQLESRFNAALATFDGASNVAANTPTEVSSAEASLKQAEARYQSQLAPIDDVAQAQRLMVQARIDDALARLSVWRAQLEIDTVRGDIQPFLAEASK